MIEIIILLIALVISIIFCVLTEYKEELWYKLLEKIKKNGE